MTVYLVLMDCGDYYCESEHAAGVYSSQADAETALAAALRLPSSQYAPPGTKRYENGQVFAVRMDADPFDYAAEPVLSTFG